MIKTELYKIRKDGVNLYRTYSDAGMMIQQETGAIYSEAIDVNTTHSYTETNIPIKDKNKIQHSNKIQRNNTDNNV